jgi:hypothetical protein
MHNKSTDQRSKMSIEPSATTFFLFSYRYIFFAHPTKTKGCGRSTTPGRQPLSCFGTGPNNRCFLRHRHFLLRSRQPPPATTMQLTVDTCYPIALVKNKKHTHTHTHTARPRGARSPLPCSYVQCRSFRTPGSNLYHGHGHGRLRRQALLCPETHMQKYKTQ